MNEPNGQAFAMYLAGIFPNEGTSMLKMIEFQKGAMDAHVEC